MVIWFSVLESIETFSGLLQLIQAAGVVVKLIIGCLQENVYAVMIECLLVMTRCCPWLYIHISHHCCNGVASNWSRLKMYEVVKLRNAGLMGLLNALHDRSGP